MFGISRKKRLTFSPQAIYIHTVLSIKFLRSHSNLSLKVKTKREYWKKQINVAKKKKKILNKIYS